MPRSVSSGAPERARLLGSDAAGFIASTIEAHLSEVAGHRGGPQYVEWVRSALPSDEEGIARAIRAGEAVAVSAKDAPSSLLVALIPPGSHVAKVVFVWVDPQDRGRGVGLSLLQHLFACLPPRVTEVDALALPGDRAAKNLFEKAGLKARLLVMNRPVRG